jgi:hypothetical protein
MHMNAPACRLAHAASLRACAQLTACLLGCRWTFNLMLGYKFTFAGCLDGSSGPLSQDLQKAWHTGVLCGLLAHTSTAAANAEGHPFASSFLTHILTRCNEFWSPSRSSKTDAPSVHVP